ncbi:unnamed protein product, partial [Vitis vinifera]
MPLRFEVKNNYLHLLEACIQSKSLTEAKKIHQHFLKNTSNADSSVLHKLTRLYLSCNQVVLARRLFDEIPNPSVILWNQIIRAYAWNGPFDGAIDLYHSMLHLGVRPNKYTYPFVLKACSGLLAIEDGVEIHSHAKMFGLESDVFVCTALVDFYAKCGILVEAQRLFSSMSHRDVVAWNAMIAGCSLYGLCDDAVQLIMQMQEEGICPNSSTIVGVLPTCQCLLYARKIFDVMGVRNEVSWSAMIGGYVASDCMKEALDIFRMMQLSGIDPDLTTMLGVLPACSHLAALQHGFCSHGYLIVRGFATDTLICNALIDMYSKCGKISFAREVFNRMDRHDIVSWNAMIIGYGIHGLGMEALGLFHDLLALGLKPDDITFICLLSSCSHSGLVMEGRLWFDAMSRDFSIVPRMEHCICMVDILGRAGLIDEAHHFIRNMPFEPDVRIWSALLSACRIHKNIELGEEVSKKIQSLGPESTGNFVLLSNIYSAAGRWDDAAHIRITQKDWGLKKIPGCSWIEINGIVHAFVGGDQSHLQLSQINRKLEELLVEMKRLGYQAECSFVFQDVEEEEKEQILLYHSEKLAIAFGILNLKAGRPILVTKNLRVCGDCHTAIKFMTLITKREITVRDANRFHHFKNGTCNCGDFW